MLADARRGVASSARLNLEQAVQLIDCRGCQMRCGKIIAVKAT